LFFRLEPGAESLRGYGRVILLSELQLFKQRRSGPKPELKRKDHRRDAEGAENYYVPFPLRPLRLCGDI
jgi:hypothetical protein